MPDVDPVLNWLLEPDSPSLRYRTLTEIMGRDPAEPEVRAAKSGIGGSAEVRRILDAMHPEGYWLQLQPSTGRMVGEGVEYGAFATTHFCLAYLAELGLSREHPQIRLAAERYLDLQQPDGDFWQHFSCLYAYNIRTFLLLGYGGDPRLRRTIELMLRTERPDGGYLCDMHEAAPGRKRPKSCYRGSVKALLAFAMLPELWESPRRRELLAYFLKRDAVFQTSRPDTPVNKDAMQLIFPVIWRSGLLDVLLALSMMGCGNRPELARAWAILDGKRTPEGKYILDWTPEQALLKAGKRGQPCKWTTFYALLAHKYRDEVHV